MRRLQTEPGTRAQTRSQGQIMTTAPSDDTPDATGPADTVDTVETAARDSRNGGATRETEDQATHTSQPAEPSSQPSLGPADLRLLDEALAEAQELRDAVRLARGGLRPRRADEPSALEFLYAQLR